MKKISLIVLIVMLMACNAFSKNKKSGQPNIFFFFADDWGKYASTYNSFAPNTAFETPALDRFAEEGVKFNHAHVTSPSCTPCRSSLLSGQYFYRTGLGAILQGAVWDPDIPSYPLILEKAGYHIGYTYKVWSPGTPQNAPYGAPRNEYQNEGKRFCKFSQSVTALVESGKSVEEAKEEIYKDALTDFRSFIAARGEGQPYCYWFGPTNTHRTWVKGSGKALWGLNPDDLKGKMPDFLPDVPEIREDMCDYLGEVLALDEMFKRLMAEIEATGERENTLVVVSGDHGIPGFPRGKCNLYPLGTEVALFAQWPERVKGNRVIEDFVNLMDLAPTFLEAANVEIPECMTGRSIMPLLLSSHGGQIDKERDYVVTGRERHVASARKNSLPYPQRSIQTKDFLYIRNFKSDREPMGKHDCLSEPRTEPSYEVLQRKTYAAYPDMDGSPTKAWMIKNRKDEKWEMHWRLGFEKRPEEELYDLRKDPDYLNNVATDPAYASVKKELRSRLMKVLKTTNDPRVTGDGSAFDKAPYVRSKKK
ncbi:sulfatase [Puteibacter caeruleilacunae]|nr:sulfatase [Puteibacter caeruleilacunae]